MFDLLLARELRPGCVMPMMNAPDFASRLTFAGAAGTVTGSKHLLDTPHGRVLLDCGLFQGVKELRARNWQSLPFPASSLDAVVLSHAHLDHSGYLPRLVKDGFNGPVYCTRATADLVPIVLRDAAHLQEEDAERANRYGYSKHRPALPLYTREDVERAVPLLFGRPYGERFPIANGMGLMFRRAGHILGAATVDIEVPSMGTIVFSGDLGRWLRPILRDPELVPDADILLVESTYGDRLHEGRAEEELEHIITKTAARGGAVIVPAFAIGRTQELIWTLRKLEDEGRVPPLPVYLDSPMAIDVTALYCKHPDEHDIAMRDLMDEKRCPLCCREYHLVRTPAESKALNDKPGPLVIIAGSGMATGGRVLHHLKHRLPDARNTVLLSGFQAAGTRGRALQDGAGAIKIHGDFVYVRAEVATIQGLSAHADQSEILRWLRGFGRAPQHTYVVHGEPGAARTLATTIQRELGWPASVARDREKVVLPSRTARNPTGDKL